MRREGPGFSKSKTAKLPVRNICRHPNALKRAAGLRAQPCSPAVLRMAYATHAITDAESSTAHRGTWNFGILPVATRASVITAIVFCASFAPCEYETRAPVKIWRLRKVRFSGAGRPL